MNPEDNYQLYLMKYQEARHPEVPKSRMELAFEHNLEDSFFSRSSSPDASFLGTYVSSGNPLCLKTSVTSMFRVITSDYV